MTVTYTGEVATCTGFGCFWKLLFRWRGSIYKLLWPNLVVYSILYFSLSGTYRFLLNSEQRTFFEKMSLHCQVYGDLIPVSFVLGFYVSLVIKRWWDQYLCLPWPDNLALFVSSLVHGQDDRGRIMRRTIMRYVNLSLLLTLRMISPRVKKRFPTLEHVVEAGWMLPGEKKIFEDLEHKTPHTKYWMPLVWAGGIVTRARKENRVKDDFALKTLIDELNIFRGGCGGMLNYDWISIPLVYTQVVTLAVYVFFLSTLMGNQYLDPSKGYPKHQIDLFLPVFTFLQFFFYMGWLKVAESLVNPFGEDDDDFELNWLLDRNLQISYVIVDEMHQEHPEMLKDQYWDEVFPVELPYTAAAKQYHTGPPQHSAEEVEVPSHQAEFMPLDTVLEEKEGSKMNIEEIISSEHPSVQRGETHPMKIQRLSLRPSRENNSGSEQSTMSSKGKSSVLNLLSKIFHQKRNSKEEVIHLGSSASLRSRRGNKSTSRLSSTSHSMGHSRSSFVKESVPCNEFQVEIFAMSDLDISNKEVSLPNECDNKSTVPHHSPSNVLSNICKNDPFTKQPGDILDADPSRFMDYHKKKEAKIAIGIIPQGFDKKEVSPSHALSAETHSAKVILQNSSPVPHIFAPENSTAFVPSVKLPSSIKEPNSKFNRFDVKVTSEKDIKQQFYQSTDICSNLKTIMPPADSSQMESVKILSEVKNFNFLNDPDTSVNSESSVFDSGKSITALLPSSLPVNAITPLQPATITANFVSYVEKEIKNKEIEKIISTLPSTKESLSKVDNSGESNIKVNDSKLEPMIIYSCNVVDESSSSSEKEELGLITPDPTMPSAAIPVPAVSHAHVSPCSDDLDLGRRSLMHELEPIIEHKDEGTLSVESSTQIKNLTSSLLPQTSCNVEKNDDKI